MLAAIEGEESNVSLATLDRIAAALGLTFAELLRDPGLPSNSAPVLAWQSRSRRSSAVLLQSAPATRSVELWEMSLAPDERYLAEPDRPGMREQVLVISGTLTLQVDGESTDLVAGASITFESDRRYEYRNAGKKPVRFVRNVVD